MSPASVYDETERFKRGWVAGFYDALSDEGARWLGGILLYGVSTDDQAQFIAGYQKGRAFRRGEWCNTTPVPSELTSAA